MELTQQLQEAHQYIRSLYSGSPIAGVILGSGLGNFTDRIEVEMEIPYSDIPHFPVSTVAGHKGRLIFGKLAGKTIVCMAGRFHFYEGYTPQQIVFPVRVMIQLGISSLLLSNAAGGMNPAFKVGDLMIIKDHVSFFMPNPLVGKNEDSLGPRFPDMTAPYYPGYIEKAKQIASYMGVNLYEGVYTAVTGPTFETRAEYAVLKALKIDAVGMSTVPECIAAVHMGIKVFAMSVITDLGGGEQHQEISHEEVLKAATEAEPILTSIFTDLIQQI